jgi:phenylalanyl-tRNA synthetase alpha chain
MDPSEEARQLETAAQDAIRAARTLEDLEAVRVKYLGRKGLLTGLLRELGGLDPESRRELGRLLNEAKNGLSGSIEERKAALKRARDEESLEEESLDITLPGRAFAIGSVHPTIKMMREIMEVFLGMGFTSVEGPEIETEYNNFDALNTPEWHPSRDEHDSFYVADGFVLRTHTSPAQIRVMKSQPPPVRVIVPGRCHRRDTPDVSHVISFYQVEGLYVDYDVSMADLKGTLANFAREVFGPETRVRFRPHFFPFTEPSAELDISCLVCGGKGCRLCKQSGWLEVLGCGMVHPNVFKHVGYDPRNVMGYAFGMGVERLALLKYGIENMRILYDNDLRFLRQFA